MQGFDHSLDSGKPGFLLADRYQIQQQLGKKAGRRTLLADDLETGEQVVVKLLTFGSDFEWDDLKLFEREAETLQALDYPAIPRYLNHFEYATTTGKGFALVQTYIKALSLEQQLKQGRSFSEAEVKQLARDLLEILSYLHRRQPAVIHRDLKPSNILLSDRSGNSPGQIYLVDFGSVQTLAGREGGTITVVGTYGYMPPEQFGGRAVPASDVYSLGATLICLVTGQHPADLPQTDLRIQFEQAAHLSPSFATWLTWITEPSLSKRPASAQEALDALDRRKFRSTSSASPSVRSIQKPEHSKVQIIREIKFLEILLPARQVIFSSNMSWLLLVFLLFVPPLLLTGLLLLAVFYLVFSVLGKIRLKIDQQHIQIIWQLLGWRVRTRTMMRRHIWKLEFAKGQPQLYLWIGTERCQLRGNFFELEWLATELSDWLDLPIE